MDAIELTKEDKEFAVHRLQAYFRDERDEELGDLGAILFYDFIAKELGPLFFNRGLLHGRAAGAPRGGLAGGGHRRGEADAARWAAGGGDGPSERLRRVADRRHGGLGQRDQRAGGSLLADPRGRRLARRACQQRPADHLQLEDRLHAFEDREHLRVDHVARDRVLLGVTPAAVQQLRLLVSRRRRRRRAAWPSPARGRACRTRPRPGGYVDQPRRRHDGVAMRPILYWVSGNPRSAGRTACGRRRTRRCASRTPPAPTRARGRRSAGVRRQSRPSAGRSPVRRPRRRRPGCLPARSTLSKRA